MRARRAAPALLGAGAVAVGAWRFVVLAGHGRQPAYAMPPGVMPVAAVALVMVVLGAAVIARSARVDITVLSVLTTFLLVYGVLGIFSIGLPLLALGVATCSVLVRRLSGGVPRSVLAAGPGLAVGLVTLVVLAGQLPVVSCQRGGMTGGTPIWLYGGGASGGSGSVSSSSDGDVHSGRVTLGGSTFTFTCTGDRLVRFR
jgi:hypothetical protein